MRNLQVHIVSDPIPVPSVRHSTVRFSHPAVRHVISALPTPLSTAGPTISEHPIERHSADVDFAGQVNASDIYRRRSRVTNTVLFEKIYNQLDGVLDHPRHSQLLRRREAQRKVNGKYRGTVPKPALQPNDKAWPVEGICGTVSAPLKTKSGLKALQYLSFQPPIPEEAFSDEAIFATDRSREQHLQATLDQLNGPRQGPFNQPSLGATQSVDHEEFTPASFLAFNPSGQPRLTSQTIPETQSTSKPGRMKPLDRQAQHNFEWESALRTVQQQNRGTSIPSPPVQAEPPNFSYSMVSTPIDNRRPDTAVSATPDFPTPKPDNLKRRTLLQSTALDLYLTTPAGPDTSITPCFPVMDEERELHRRTIIGGQQRDLALTPSNTGLAIEAPAGLPRTFSIPRRGVGQASKPKTSSGPPQPRLEQVIEALSASSSSNVNSASTPAAVTAQAATGNVNQLRTSSFGSHHALQSESFAKPKLSRMAVLKKIIAKTY